MHSDLQLATLVRKSNSCLGRVEDLCVDPKYKYKCILETDVTIDGKTASPGKEGRCHWLDLYKQIQQHSKKSSEEHKQHEHQVLSNMEVFSLD